MNIKEYENKVRGCWLGKNIGGSLGAPFECRRGVFDVDFYTHDITQGVLPNDDLDLQLIFLNAAEKYGTMLNSEILGEYWLSHIIANWSEYGAARNNMEMGLLPPFSGEYNNHNKNSCGSFIRSEIWACLTPGHPEKTVELAYEDAIVDHADEGVYAEIFCAAMLSAAFSESDVNNLIDIGLSYIPAECDVAIAVKTVLDCYKNGDDWKAARKKVLQVVPGTFGMYVGYEDREPEDDIPLGEPGYDAPSNIGLTVLGLLYGEGDFSKSICLAVNCGEDADCTAGIVGSILGIIMGADKIPSKWIEPIGDEIKTVSIDTTDSDVKIPKTVSELTQRVCTLMPTFMKGDCDILSDDGVILSLRKDNMLYSQEIEKGLIQKIKFNDKLEKDRLGLAKSNSILSVVLNIKEGINITDGVEKEFSLSIDNLIRKQQWLTVKWHTPEEWTVIPAKTTCVNLDQAHGGTSLSEKKYKIIPNGVDKGRYDLLLEIRSNGRISTLFIPVTLFA